MSRRTALLLLFLTVPAQGGIPADWTAPLTPFRVAGNLYYVGSRDLAAYLVATPEGNILINANLESSPPLIRRSVEQLGFRWADTRILLSSQAHYDHAAGAARVIRETRARHMVMGGDEGVIRSGGATDFDPSLPRFPAARVDRILHDNDTVSLGGTTITAHRTAGHTRGCTTWTLQVREGGATRNVVIVGGWGPLPGVRLVNRPGKPEAYPGIAADAARTFALLAALPCDIFLGAHGIYFDLSGKFKLLPERGPAVWTDPDGYRRAVAEHEAEFRKQLSEQ